MKISDLIVRYSQRGFSLIEIVLSLFIVSFSLILILGLLQVGVTSEKSTIGRTAATSLTTSVYSDLITTPSEEPVSPIFEIPISPGNPSPQTIFFSQEGQPTGSTGDSPTPLSVYRVSVSFPESTENSTYASTLVRILVTWPAQVDPNPNEWPTKASGRVEVITALDRNAY